MTEAVTHAATVAASHPDTLTTVAKLLIALLSFLIAFLGSWITHKTVTHLKANSKAKKEANKQLIAQKIQRLQDQAKSLTKEMEDAETALERRILKSDLDKVNAEIDDLTKGVIK